MDEDTRRLAAACPFAHTHNMGPEGYNEWFEWAARMDKTHDQAKCPGCRLWVLWKVRTTKETTHYAPDGSQATGCGLAVRKFVTSDIDNEVDCASCRRSTIFRIYSVS